MGSGSQGQIEKASRYYKEGVIECAGEIRNGSSFGEKRVNFKQFLVFFFDF